MKARPRILGANGRPFEGRSTGARPSTKRAARGRYDAAQTSDDNRRHWSMADGLSSRMTNSPAVRALLRNRSRYEIANNSYAHGLGLTLANDTIGIGPSLQMHTGDEGLDTAIEEAFCQWGAEVRLASKLRTMRLSRYGDGEAFALMTSNPRLMAPIELDLRLIEADQVTTPNIDPFNYQLVDGINYDPFGNPLSFNVLKYHPGDVLGFGALFGQYDEIPARLVLHWMRVERPGQVRGVPEITAALPLFAQLRRYTLAVIAAAETAADFAAVLQSTSAPDDETPAGEPFEALEIEKRMLTTLPQGWVMNQFRPEQPSTNYKMFKEEILAEIGRTLCMPFNLISGNSAGYNYASGRLDYQIYFRNLRVDQVECERVVLDPIFYAWLDEMSRATDLLPGGADRLDGWAHEWIWNTTWHVDPQKEADAQATRLANNTTTLANEYAARGLDWETQLRQRAREVDLCRELGLAPAAALPGPPAPGAPGSTPATPAEVTVPPDEGDAEEEDEYGTEDET